jgi:hypothetical protein
MNGGFKFEVQLSLPAADTAKRLQLKAQGCRFGIDILSMPSNLTPLGRNELGRRERTDHDVVPIRISERELHSSSVRVHLRLLLEPSDKSTCPCQRHVEIIDPEKQEKAVARLCVIGARQGGMIMSTPLVKAEQDRSIRVEDLAEVIMGGSRFRQAK